MRERWLAVAGRVSGASTANDGIARAIYDDLVTRYTAPDRHYHNLAHIEACLSQLDAARWLAQEPGAIELAIWFHDAIYDTHRADNEQASAQLALDALARLQVSLALAHTVSDLILATRHNVPPATPDAALLIDIDLSILGQPAAVFDAYEVGVRHEYAWVSEENFRAGRSKVLRAFLERPRLYATDHYYNGLESKARQNLARSLAQLAS